MKRYIVSIIAISAILILPMLKVCGEQDPDIHYNLGISYYNPGNAYDEKGMFGEAVYAWKDALDIDPDIMGAHFNPGIDYGKNEMYKEAIDEYKQILARRPKGAEALYNPGVAGKKDL